MLASSPPALAHLVLYPYATAELFFRYCRLNASIMDLNLGPLLGSIRQPALVVTSQDDRTAHPAGSRTVAEALPRATLRVAAHGDHLSVFEARPELVQLAVDFLSRPQERALGSPGGPSLLREDGAAAAGFHDDDRLDRAGTGRVEDGGVGIDQLLHRQRVAIGAEGEAVTRGGGADAGADADRALDDDPPLRGHRPSPQVTARRSTP